MSFRSAWLAFLAISIVISTRTRNVAGVERNTKLILAQTTQYGGYITKTYELEDDTCSSIAPPWADAYNRWAFKLVGKCVAVFKSRNCRGQAVELTQDKPTFKEFIAKVRIFSIRHCGVEAAEEEETTTMVPEDFGKLPLLGNRFLLEGPFDLQNNDNGNEDIPDIHPPSVSDVEEIIIEAPPRVESTRFKSPIIFYSYPNFRGGRFVARPKARRCLNFPVFFQGRVSSVQNGKECIRLYDSRNCEGQSVQVLPEDPAKSNLIMIDFDRMAHSFGICEEFQQLGLELHNQFRALHHSPPLRMRETLNSASQMMAEFLAAQSTLPRPVGHISAELFYATNNGPEDTLDLVQEAINSWYSEKSIFDWNNPVASRFTQLVWKNTRDFGVGTARRGNRSVVVASYFPRGNYPGEFHNNVLRSNRDY